MHVWNLSNKSHISAVLIMQAGHRWPFTEICILYITVIIYISPYRERYMEFTTKVEQLCVLHYSLQKQPFLFSTLKSRTSTFIRTIKYLLNVISSNSHIRGIQVELIEDELLFRSDDLYCHGVLHLKQQGLDAYLIEKVIPVKPTFFY